MSFGGQVMRWDHLVDAFSLIKKGKISRATTHFTGEEDFFAEHHPGHPSVPEPFFVEMIAQTGGVLYGLGIDFKKEVILVKIEDAVFHTSVKPPCRLDIEARIEGGSEDGAWISGSVSMDGKPVATAKIMLIAIESLNDLPAGKVVFNDGFLKHYDVWNVVKKSEGVAV